MYTLLPDGKKKYKKSFNIAKDQLNTYFHRMSTKKDTKTMQEPN